MNTVVIGSGGIAQKAYFPLLATMPSIRIIGIHSHTRQNMEKALQQWHFPFGTTNIDEIISLKPQTAIVISSTASHFDICKKLLENEIDVYAEKSLTTTSQESFDLYQIAAQHERILAVGFNRRYALLNKQAKQILEDRKIHSALIQKHRAEASYTTLAQQFLDDTIHQIDLMRFFCGEVTPLQTTYAMENNMVVTNTSTSLTIPGGGIGTLLTSGCAGAWQESVTIHASGITVHVDAFRKLQVIEDDRETVYGLDRAGKWITAMKERGFLGELEHFFNCVQTRMEPQTNAKEAAKTLQLMEAMLDQKIDIS